MTFSVRQAHSVEIPALVAIFEAAFRTDRHTRVQTLDGGPQILAGSMHTALASWLESAPQRVVLVAVDDATGMVLGWACWSRHGYGDHAPPASVAGAQSAEKPRSALLMALEMRTNRDRERWQAILMPPGTRCRILVAIAVSPDHQSRGVGTALIRWGTERADRDGVFCWVHASEAGAAAFTRHGFVEVGRLEVDLDEYAPAPPSGVDPAGCWGTYTFRYMKRLPIT